MRLFNCAPSVQSFLHMCFLGALVTTGRLSPLALHPAQTQPSNDALVQRLYDEAKAAEAHGDSGSAIAKSQAILRIAPKRGSAYNNLGLLYFKQRDYENAVSVLEQG